MYNVFFFAVFRHLEPPATLLFSWGPNSLSPIPGHSCIYLPNLLRQWNYTSCYASDLRFNSAYFGLAGQYVFKSALPSRHPAHCQACRLPVNASSCVTFFHSLFFFGCI